MKTERIDFMKTTRQFLKANLFFPSWHLTPILKIVAPYGYTQYLRTINYLDSIEIKEIPSHGD